MRKEEAEKIKDLREIQEIFHSHKNNKDFSMQINKVCDPNLKGETHYHLAKDVEKMKKDWWQNLSSEIQQAFDRKDSKTFYHMLKQAYRPKSSTTSNVIL